MTALVLITLLPAAPALAAATDWQEVAPGAELRVISAGSARDGKALVGLELVLEPGLNTYWRVPGETGVPTEVVVTDQSGNGLDAELAWPLPERDTSLGFVDFVYRDELVLPMFVQATTDKTLRFDVTMGICSDICVPVRAEFSLPGDGKPDAANGLRLRQALAETPLPFAGEEPPLSAISLDAESGALSLAYDGTRVDPERVFPSFDGSGVVFSAPEIDRAAGRMVFSLLVRKGDTSWQGLPLRLSFATSDGPYDIVESAPGR